MKIETLKSPEEYGCKIENRVCLFKTSPFSQWWGCFSNQSSNFTSHKLCDNWDDPPITYMCAEQFMMAAKAKLFGDKETLEKIMNERNPREMQALGRQVKNYDQEIWDSMKFELVSIGNFQKFTQNEHLKNFIMQFPYDTKFAESTAIDLVWGTGIDIDDPACFDQTLWSGKNLLGDIIGWVRKYAFTKHQN